MYTHHLSYSLCRCPLAWKQLDAIGLALRESAGVGAGWPQRFFDGRGRGGGGKMQSRCHCCLSSARNHRRETLLFSQVAPPASRHRGAVLVLCVARTREAGEVTKKRLAGGREVERSWCPGPELGRSVVNKRECSASCREPVDLGATAYQPVHL